MAQKPTSASANQHTEVGRRDINLGTASVLSELHLAIDFSKLQLAIKRLCIVQLQPD